MTTENSISQNKSFLINLYTDENKSADAEYLIEHFCGQVVKHISEIPASKNCILVYAIGDMDKIKTCKKTILVIRELSFNYEDLDSVVFQPIELGKVPLNIHNAGVFYRRFFEAGGYFKKIESEHEFQNLTQSNKESMALRTGIYLTKVTKEEDEKRTEMLRFRLLRCSSNLTGPTDNLRATDIDILKDVNEAIEFTFEERTDLNHVLAQIYENKKKENFKEAKAKIKAHSDKTKDMPSEGLIAFCTFYDRDTFAGLEVSKTDPFDWCYKKASVFTRLLFKLKKTVNDEELEKEFSVTLYPNSLFIIPLSTNRLYTHEIRPSALNIDKIPIRMGYVIRCSNLEAVFMNAQTFIKENGKLVKLEQMENETMDDLRASYVEENQTENIVEYGKVHFSMNLGDYQKPKH